MCPGISWSLNVMEVTTLKTKNKSKKHIKHGFPLLSKFCELVDQEDSALFEEGITEYSTNNKLL